MSKSALNNYEQMKKLGQGSFGVVYKVRRRDTNKVYVLKQIDTKQMSRQQRAESQKEAAIMERLSHKYIVRMIESFTTDMKICIILELCENGDLG